MGKNAIDSLSLPSCRRLVVLTASDSGNLACVDTGIDFCGLLP